MNSLDLPVQRLTIPAETNNIAYITDPRYMGTDVYPISVAGYGRFKRCFRRMRFLK